MMHEGQHFTIEVTVEAICGWKRKHDQDHLEVRENGLISTTLFSLLQSFIVVSSQTGDWAS